jgi:hypothetical protein
MTAANGSLAEPITVAEWWKNRRGESVRLVLNTFEGRNVVDLKPGKGFAAEVKHLPRLAAALAKAEAQARELGLIDSGAADE